MGPRISWADERGIMSKQSEREAVQALLVRCNWAPDTDVLLAAVAQPNIKRRGVAAVYGGALRMEFGLTDWKCVNRAILERWSMSGLRWIKHLAWKAVEGSGA